MDTNKWIQANRSSKLREHDCGHVSNEKDTRNITLSMQSMVCVQQLYSGATREPKIVMHDT